ncbi:GntR family transcriptional regulator [Micromonospora arida]|uniref:GntR family transcriptional regulator n=1 Tax=Micromonospora zamorensis TaxID=709883 RepID=UPI002E22DA2B
MSTARWCRGERLNDADLARWLGVSRTPVREALARLEKSGLVQTKPGPYTMVSPLDVQTARAAQLVTAAMHELAVRQAVPNLSADEIEAMRAANARFAAALQADDVDAAIASDDEFHGVAVTASANPGASFGAGTVHAGFVTDGTASLLLAERAQLGGSARPYRRSV